MMKMMMMLLALLLPFSAVDGFTGSDFSLNITVRASLLTRNARHIDRLPGILGEGNFEPFTGSSSTGYVGIDMDGFDEPTIVVIYGGTRMSASADWVKNMQGSMRFCHSIQGADEDANFCDHDDFAIGEEDWEHVRLEGMVHKGFLGAYQETEHEVAERILKFKGNHRAMPILFAGHSLGAAQASICSLLIGADVIEDSPTALYTFGAPRVGNALFVQRLRASPNLNNRVFRIVNYDDVVTTVPNDVTNRLISTLNLGYALVDQFLHGGREVIFWTLPDGTFRIRVEGNQGDNDLLPGVYQGPDDDRKWGGLLFKWMRDPLHHVRAHRMQSYLETLTGLLHSHSFMPSTFVGNEDDQDYIWVK